MFGEVLLSLLVALLSAGYFYVKQCYNYWEKRGFPYVKPTFPFGTFKDLMLQKISMGDAFKDIYNNANTKCVGTFLFMKPILVVCDQELCDQILIKDFSHFADRGLYCDESYDPMSGHLAALQGERWKKIRGKLAPAFTAIKLKAMFPTMLGAGYHLIGFLNEKSKTGETFEAGDLSARYTTDSIAAVAFGSSINSVKDPDEEFRQVGAAFFAPTLSNSFRNAFMFLYPQLLKPLGLKFLPKQTEDFFVALVKKTIEERELNETEHRDFMQILLQLRNSNEINSDDGFKFKTSNIKNLTIHQLAAQALLFFIAGFETSSSTMAFCLYEIAKNPRIQEKIQEEIDQVIGDSVDITYDDVMNLKYLEACIQEVLRKYSPLPFLNRKCTKSYKIPNTDLVIEEGVSIVVPSNAFQRDDKFFPDPEEFKPERFINGLSNQLNLTFGEGPRMCVAPKIGAMQTKIGLTIVLREFNFKLSNQMNRTLKFEPRTFISVFEGGIQLKAENRNKILQHQIL